MNGQAGRGVPRNWRHEAVGLVCALVVAAIVATLLRIVAPIGAMERDEPFDYIAAKAEELHADPDAVVAFVRDDVSADGYDGALRGPVGTLWAGAGNDLDRALLLRALLDHVGEESRLVRGEAWGVEVDEGDGEYTYVGPTLTADAAAVASTPGAGEYHTLSVIVRTTMFDGTTIDNEAGTFRAADLTARDIGVHYRSDDGRVYLVVDGPGSSATVPNEVGGAQAQSLVFRMESSTGAAIERTRELFTKQYDEYLSTFDTDNRYMITVTTGWVSAEVRDRETASVNGAVRDHDTPEGRDALGHVIAYTFLASSDANTLALADQQEVEAHLTSPRLTIVANEANPEAEGARSVSLDLRKNDVAVDSSPEDQVELNAARSLYDGALESQVLRQITGQETQSAADALAHALQGNTATIADRATVLAQSVQRLLSDPVGDGAEFSVSPAGFPDDTVTYTRDGENVRVQASDSLAAKLAASNDSEVTWLLSAPTITPADDVTRAVGAAEIALANADELPMDYEADYRFTPSPQWYRDVTQFEHGNPVQQLSISIDPELVISLLPYYAGNEPPADFEPTSDSLSTVTISEEDLEHSHEIKNWFMDTDSSDGATIMTLSRDVYAELTEDGSSVVTFRHLDGTMSEPVRLYVVDRFEQPIVINGIETAVPMLNINGDFDANHSPQPEFFEGPDIVDPSNTTDGAMNKFPVLADPDYPLSGYLFFGTNYQSAVPGSVVDAATGRPVMGATVSVVEPGVTTTSWADGSFSIPAMDREFAEFEVEVAAPGYETLTTAIDFSDPSSLPVDLELTAVDPPEPTWINAQNIDAALGAVTLLPRSQDLIRASIEANPDVTVLVPGQTVSTQHGPIDGWIEVNARTGEMYPLFPDGLYGASTVRDILGLGSGVGDAASRGAGWAYGKFSEWLKGKLANPFDPNRAAADAPITFFAGHIAGWYYFAAGALQGVSAHIDDPSMSLCDLHRITVVNAAAMVNGDWYQTGAGMGLSYLLQKGYDIPELPIGNSQLVGLTFKAGALTAIAGLAEATKNDWGLAGTNC